MKTVAIVDDHTLIAQALARIVNQFNDFKVIFEVNHGKALMEQLGRIERPPDVVLLDINMPVMDGFETARWLREHHPKLLIMALSVQDKEETLIKMIRCGATGYLLKNVRAVELEQALHAMCTRGYYYPDWVAHSVISSLANGKTDAHEPPNEREILFLELAATELTYKEIADRMHCSPRTVEGYRDGLFEKFKVRTRVSLVVYAIKNGLIALED